MTNYTYNENVFLPSVQFKVYYLVFAYHKIGLLVNCLGCSNYHGNESVQNIQQFLCKCRQHLKEKKKFFWITFQSNVLVDTAGNMLTEDFNLAFKDLKKNLSSNDWLLPNLNANMRNQKNIYNISVKGSSQSKTDTCNTALSRLRIGSTVIGELPFLLKIRRHHWSEKETELLNHAVKLIDQKSERNIIILHDASFSSCGIENTLKEVLRNKTVLSYPYPGNNPEGIKNFQDFCEKKNHLLVTQVNYFNGCEAPNVIYLSEGGFGIRNAMLRAVERLVCVLRLLPNDTFVSISGVKEDNSFYQE